MSTLQRRSSALLLIALGGTALSGTAAPAVAQPSSAVRASPPALGAAATPSDAVQAATSARPARGGLDLGPANLKETRVVSHPQAGVTLTQITRGEPDPSLVWTLEVLIAAAPTSPDPDAPPRVLADRASATAEAARLQSEGFTARIERVAQPKVADVAAGTLGYRVRVGRYASKEDADAAVLQLKAAGESANSVYTGWDGDRSDRGPWHVKVITIDPRTFRGRLSASYGPDLESRETTSTLSRAEGATLGVNAGFFVLDPAAGAPGDPAGVGVYGGRLLSEPVRGRPALLVRNDATRSQVKRFTWKGTATVGGTTIALDGVDRVPGLIRNCGGDSTDQPTDLPLHDFTCTDDSELVAFTSDFGPSTPAGPGLEVVLDAHSVVREVAENRGTILRAGWTTLQATGTATAVLDNVRVGDRVSVRTALVDESGRKQSTPAGTSIVNGGPLLVRDGREHITQRRDGMVHPDDPSFAYGWVIKRNPRTFAGVDARGRTVLITTDGRTASDLGLSIPETADVARSLGLVDAINLDGGGSTTMTLHGRVINAPSDTAGERPVGDALLVLPRR